MRRLVKTSLPSHFLSRFSHPALNLPFATTTNDHIPLASQGKPNPTSAAFSRPASPSPPSINRSNVASTIKLVALLRLHNLPPRSLLAIQLSFFGIPRIERSGDCLGSTQGKRCGSSFRVGWLVITVGLTAYSVSPPLGPLQIYIQKNCHHWPFAFPSTVGRLFVYS
ncbi:hypothetical protein M407DRAFT_28813 [Tulasnella calospora MUT 4182]|uniref:Uncharacterized protein n=1 Tax=Tulasnella calospora MUT 4182 TaxID=1051891 RepID=A0A0C3Q0Q2_9AGAM|nr:hypothetical protein M407DRAFT_28813 [Tulasnella calospora MUT 4182]